MMTFLLILALLVAVIAVIFALQNTAAVTVSFFFWHFEQSLALVLLLAVLAGVLIGLLTILPTVIRSKFKVTSQKKKLDQLEKSLQEAKIKQEDTERQLNLLQQKPEPINQTTAIPDPETQKPSDI